MLTIIVPVYNEKKFIRVLLKKLIKIIKIKKQIIIIDDGSSDGTTEILKKEFLNNKSISKIIFHKKNSGKGSAIRSAQRFIKGDLVVIQDADLEYNPKDIIKIYNFIKKNQIDVVYGSRVLNKNKYQNTKNFTHLVRIWGNVFLTLVSNLINNQNLTDAHTCYKMIRARIFKKLNLREKGFAFCPEVTTKLSKINCKIYEVSISYNGRTYNDGKKITSIDGLIALISLIKYRLFD
jgi:glycosyltransferase involved in cell wall biosynthesis|tara:strand:+ start:685 stop:1389 length:705 start_codon:yes stop_codon:yes gene_type:complete